MEVLEIKTKEEFENEVLNCQEEVIVDFNAEWCGPCKMLKPIIDEVAGEGHKVVSVNIDRLESVAADYDVMSIPCLVVIKDGKETNRSVGFQGKDEILELL